jgi:hypothetical protein
MKRDATRSLADSKWRHTTSRRASATCDILEEKGDHSVQAKHQARTESQPTRREVELDHLLQEVAEDARERAARYPKDTIVPEGGE